MIPFNPPSVSLSEDWEGKVKSPTDREALTQDVFWESETAHLLFVPWVYIPATRISLPGEFDDHAVPLNKSKLFDGVNVAWPDNSQIFDNRWVEAVVKELFDHFKTGTVEFFEFRSALRRAYTCAAYISREILTGSPVNYVSYPSDIFGPEEIDPLTVEPYVHPGMGVFEAQDLSHKSVKQYVGNLSSGTQGAYLWVLFVSLKMAEHYKFERGWHEKPAILLIDEVENHLHPTWQRRVIPALLEHFPGLQIFATTHSPFVVAGLKAGQVHLLSRDENGVVSASTNEQDIIGWTMDEILRTMMGVPDPTDEATAQAAQELRELRNDVPAPTEAEEEKRQERIRELRGKVDRDLLAGGPAAAQREIFEEHLAEILERHRQAQSMNQENG